MRATANSGTVRRFVGCPECGRQFTKALYDWQFIYCHECRTYFEKHTGNRIECTDRPPQRYWHYDNETPNYATHAD